MCKLKDLRAEKKLTQQQVADLVGISLRSYKSYENDEKKVSKAKIEKLAEEKFGDLKGLAQQYLFYWRREQ